MTKQKTKRVRSNEPKLKGAFEPAVYKGMKNIKGRSRRFSIGYETEKIPYEIRRSCNYIPDFVIEFKDGRKVYIECKGYLRGNDIVKLLSVKDQHPEIDLRIIFQKNNKLRGRKNMRYSDWAEKNGLPYAIGEIPREWFE